MKPIGIAYIFKEVMKNAYLASNEYFHNWERQCGLAFSKSAKSKWK